MKYLIAFVTIFFSLNSASALTLEEIASDETLTIQDSRGPKYRQDLESHALDEWDAVVDLNSVIDDGLIHSVYEGLCDPDVYDVDEIRIEMDDWPQMHVVFNSIKKGSKSIAYVARPVVVYEPTYTVYETHADYKKGVATEIKLECAVQSEVGFYYEHNENSEVIYIGYAYDLEEFVNEETAPEYGVLINGESIEAESEALALYDEFKKAELSDADVNVCYFGDWERAVESANNAIEIGVIDIYGAGELEVEVLSRESGEYTYGLIRVCN